MMAFFNSIVAPGFFQSEQVLNALWIGTVVAIVSGMVGVFVVIRGQSFVGHVLTDIGAAGASGAFLIGINAWYGFLSFGLLAGTGVEYLGNRARNRDVATGIILSFAMGLGALFLYLDTVYTNHPGAPLLVMFGSIFLIDPSMTPVVVVVGLVSIVLLCVLYRPLLLCSVSPETARARGIPVRLVGFGFMVVLAAAVEDGAVVAGALLSTALLIGPAAVAIRVTSRTGWALCVSACTGVIAIWLGILLAYDSALWPPQGRGWPVSFFIAVLIFAFYWISRFLPMAKPRSRQSFVKEVTSA